MSKISTAEILCIGTELLLGDIVNTNASFISRELASLGISVYRQSVVGDNPTRMKDAITESFSRSDCLVLTGGLGPTCDDLTKEIVAEYFALDLSPHNETLERIERYFAEVGRVMTENNKKQALVPVGAVVLQNDWGTAPGLIVEKNGKTAILLPGPPSEMRPMWKERVRPYLESRTDSTIVSRNIHIIGMGESAVEEILRPLMTSLTNPTVAPYASDGECRVRVSAKAKNTEEGLSMCDSVVEEILKTAVGSFVYGIDVESEEEALVPLLMRHSLTIATAESCTGGLVGKRLTDLSGVSSVYLGGCITYSNEAKMSLVGVSAETLRAHGAVSPETAAEMARGARLALSSDIGISTTGIAGPGGGTPEKPVGLVYIAISTSDGERVQKLSFSPNRSRDYIRYSSASRALALVLEYLTNKF